MELTEDFFFEKHRKRRIHFMSYCLVQSEYEFSCMTCEFHVMKRKNEHTKVQRKKLNYLSNRLKHA